MPERLFETAYCKPLRVLAEALMMGAPVLLIIVESRLWITMWVKVFSGTESNHGACRYNFWPKFTIFVNAIKTIDYSDVVEVHKQDAQ